MRDCDIAAIVSVFRGDYIMIDTRVGHCTLDVRNRQHRSMHRTLITPSTLSLHVSIFGIGERVGESLP